MVLQRDLPVPIWGWGDPGEKVFREFCRAEEKYHHQCKRRVDAEAG